VSERKNWKVKKLDDIDARNIRMSLYDSLIALYTEITAIFGESGER